MGGHNTPLQQTAVSGSQLQRMVVKCTEWAANSSGYYGGSRPVRTLGGPVCTATYPGHSQLQLLRLYALWLRASSNHLS